MNKVICGNAPDVLETMPAESVDCSVTSLPYYGLRNYDGELVVWGGDVKCDHDFKMETIHKEWHQTHASRRGSTPCKMNRSEYTQGFCVHCNAWRGQLGQEPGPELFISHACDVFDGVYRVLKKQGTCFVVIGDSRVGSGQGWGGKQKNQGQKNTSRRSFNGMMRTSLVGIPERFVLEMMARGWGRFNTRIWKKTNCIPESTKRRFTVDFEYVYCFFKHRKYYFDQQFEPFAESTLKDGRMGKEWSADSRGRNMRCVHEVSTTKGHKEDHHATFPEELIESLIRAGCPVGGTVLDPFGGHNTTGVVAKRLWRNSITIEINPKHAAAGRRRAQAVQRMLPELVG